MFWKIQCWLPNRKKKYLAFIHLNKKQIWSSKKWIYSDVEPMYIQKVLEIRKRDLVFDHGLHYLEKQISEQLKDTWGKDYWVKIIGLHKI